MMMLNQMTGNNPMVSTLMKSMQGKKPGRAAADGDEHCKANEESTSISFAQQFGMKIK